MHMDSGGKGEGIFFTTVLPLVLSYCWDRAKGYRMRLGLSTSIG